MSASCRPFMQTWLTHPSQRNVDFKPSAKENKKMWGNDILYQNHIFNILPTTKGWLDFLLQDSEVPITAPKSDRIL